MYVQVNLRNYDKEILQDLWKVRTGIHEIREIHRNQLDTEQKYLENSSTTSQQSHRRLSRESGWHSPESPSPPISPLSPPPVISQLSASAFNLKGSVTPVKREDDTLLESFFGMDNMSKLNGLWQSTDSGNRELGVRERMKSQSTDRLLSAGLSPLPEKKQSPKYHPLSLSPKTSRIHASTPDMSSLRRGNQPVNNICSEMQKLRMKLCETANQTVAEIEERFSPKFNQLTLGPAIDLPSNHASSNTSHSHQGSLDSYPSNSPMVTQHNPSAQHGRQRSLPLSVVSQTRSHSPTVTGVPSPSTSHHGHSNSMSPPSRSPTPPHQQHMHSRQGSQGNVSGLITTRYQNQSQEAHRSVSSHRLPQQYSTGHHGNNSVAGPPHKGQQPPPMSRQYSPGIHPGLVRTGAVVPSSEQGGYRRSNGAGHQSNIGYNGRIYSSNPNLLNGEAQDSSTHYSTAVVKKRRSSGNKTPDGHVLSSTHAHEYDQLQPTGYMQYQPQSKYSEQSRSSNRAQHTRQPHQYSEVHNVHQPSSYHHQRSNQAMSGETNFQQTPATIKPYMSTGELRSKFQYVPYAEKRKSAAQGYHGHMRQDSSENTWL